MDGTSRRIVGQLFPFHVEFDPDGIIRGVGHSMERVRPGLEGRAFLDVFEVSRPALRDMAGVLTHVDQLVMLAIRGTDLQMRGQFMVMPGGHMVFVGSPRIVDQSSVWAWPVGVRDFAPHDASADYAMVIEATNSQIADLERLVGKLREKERTERELRRAAEEASRAKTFFLANISHEIRTPMTAILGYAELLKADDLAPAERADYAETIRRNGDHLLAVIGDILDLSKIEAGQFTIEPVEMSVADVVRDVVRLLGVRAVSQGIQLSHVIEGDLARAPVRSDPVRIRQVLLNIVGNAVKFTQEGGVRVMVSARPEGERVQFEVGVHDTGPGIPAELLPRLFEPFWQSDASHTRRHGGTGLGLAISQRLAVLLGGGIEAASEPGRGSVFTFRFLADPAGSVDAGRPLASIGARATGHGPLAGRSILLVEDSVDSQRILSVLLTLAGADVAVASDGLSAVSRFDGTYCPDLVLMDIQMPVMDGIEAVTRIRAKGYRGRIVALTAAALGPERERALAAGCEAVCVKPISRSELLELCSRPAEPG